MRSPLFMVRQQAVEGIFASVVNPSALAGAHPGLLHHKALVRMFRQRLDLARSPVYFPHAGSARLVDDLLAACQPAADPERRGGILNAAPEYGNATIPQMRGIAVTSGMWVAGIINGEPAGALQFSAQHCPIFARQLVKAARSTPVAHHFNAQAHILNQNLLIAF